MRTRAAYLRVILTAVGLAASLARPLPALGQASAGYADVVAAVAPSVVTVAIERDVQAVPGFLGDSYGGVARGGGSGVVIGDGGLILTNYHVVEDATWVGVELHDGRRLTARVVGVDPPTDLALLRADALGLRVAGFADSGTVRAGDPVLALGAPFGLKHSVTVGVISATERRRTTRGVTTALLQTDAQINPGNSGGPLVNLRGQIVGINSAYLGGGTGIGFAIPANLARRVSEYLAEGGVVERGYIGVDAQSITRELATYLRMKKPAGALLAKVEADSGAEAAGLRPGDIVIGCAGAPVADADVLRDRIGQARIGSRLPMLLLRAGKRVESHVRVARAPAPRGHTTERGRDDAPLLGMQVRAVTPSLRAELGYEGKATVLITGVVPGSAADRAGLVPGLAVLEADFRPVVRPRDLLEPTGDGRALVRVEDREGDAAYLLLQRRD